MLGNKKLSILLLLVLFGCFIATLSKTKVREYDWGSHIEEVTTTKTH